ERVPQDQAEPVTHVSLAGERHEHVVPEVGAAERTVEDLGDPELTDDRAVFGAADEQPLLGTPAAPAKERVESVGGSWGIGPRMMECRAVAHAREEFVTVRRADASKEHSLALGDRPASGHGCAAPAAARSRASWMTSSACPR